MGPNLVERVVRVNRGGSSELARVVSYTDRPTFGLQLQDGRHITWQAGLCEEATHEEEVRYWRERAEAAESGASRLEEA
ncbi:MAG: hypothetical protein AAF791_04530 [Bacteroidota bacterium]